MYCGSFYSERGGSGRKKEVQEDKKKKGEGKKVAVDKEDED